MYNYAHRVIRRARDLATPRTPGRHTAAHLRTQQHNPTPQHPHTEASPDPAYLTHPVDRGELVRPYVLEHAQRRASVLTALHTRSVRVAR
jgi:hypothetical protein